MEQQTLEPTSQATPEVKGSTDVSVETLEHEVKAAAENKADRGETEQVEAESAKTDEAKKEIDPLTVPLKPEDVQPDPDDLHDKRRMKKFMQRAFEAEAKLAAKEKIEQQQAAQPQQADIPERNQFNSDAEYYNAVNLYNISIVRAEFEQKFNEQKVQESRKVLESKTNEARKEHPDFDEVVSESTVQFIPVVQRSIIDSDVSAELIYALAKDEDLAERISKLEPHLAIKELGKLEVRLEAEKGRKSIPAAKQVSKAPAPIKPLASKADSGNVDPSKMSDAEWMVWRRRQKYKLK
jgi:hypothetical protein